tara:strand:+ start:423 stop:785 length:363 start_codon:yes stop_codon:yes gene_type:complete
MACAPVGEVVETEELQIEFENLWWEILDPPAWLASGDNTMCYYFSTTHYVEEPDDGVVLYFQEGDLYSYVLSNFQRVEDAYYLSTYSIDLEILVDEDRNYFAEASQGILSQTSEIIPCSL